MLAAGMAGLYRYVPNTQVYWRHAWAGGMFVAGVHGAGQKGLALYLAKVPTYSAVYGTFATLPILLVWIYVAWVIVLLGAVVAAYLPACWRAWPRRSGPPELELSNWRWRWCSNCTLRQTSAHGLRTDELAQRLRVDALQLEPALDALTGLDWVGRLEEVDAASPARRCRAMCCWSTRRPRCWHPCWCVCWWSARPACRRCGRRPGWKSWCWPTHCCHKWPLALIGIAVAAIDFVVIASMPNLPSASRGVCFRAMKSPVPWRLQGLGAGRPARPPQLQFCLGSSARGVLQGLERVIAVRCGLGAFGRRCSTRHRVCTQHAAAAGVGAAGIARQRLPFRSAPCPVRAAGIAFVQAAGGDARRTMTRVTMMIWMTQRTAPRPSRSAGW